MWLQSSTDQAERDKAGEMPEQVLLVMPVAWQPALDQRVAEHLQKFGGI
jgi:hypothetical protein